VSTPKREGKQKWLSQVLQDHEEELRKKVRVLISRVQRDLDENDVLQELWARVLTNADRYDSRRDVLGWIYGFVRNIVREYARGNRRLVFFSWMQRREPEPLDRVLDPLFHEDPRRREEACLDLARCLDLLPARQRELLTLYHLDDVSITDLAKRYDTTEGNIRVQLTRARKAARRV